MFPLALFHHKTATEGLHKVIDFRIFFFWGEQTEPRWDQRLLYISLRFMSATKA